MLVLQFLFGWQEKYTDLKTENLSLHLDTNFIFQTRAQNGFLKKVYKVRDPRWKNVQTFSIPESVFFARIDPKTGKLPKDDDLPYTFAPFLKGTEPKPPVPKVLKLAPLDRKPILKTQDTLAPKNNLILPKPPQLRGTNP